MYIQSRFIVKPGGISGDMASEEVRVSILCAIRPVERGERSHAIAHTLHRASDRIA